jgi:hypothetical protein
MDLFDALGQSHFACRDVPLPATDLHRLYDVSQVLCAVNRARRGDTSLVGGTGAVVPFEVRTIRPIVSAMFALCDDPLLCPSDSTWEAEV